MGTWFLALMALAGAAQGPDAPQLAQLEAAFDAHDDRRITELTHDLAVSRRPEDGALRVDPLVSSLVGRLYLQMAANDVALPYLEQGVSPDLPDRQRIEALLALAEARRLNRDKPGAAEALDRLRGEALSEAQQARLLLTRAELAVDTDPRDALASIQALRGSGDPGAHFEAELLAGRAHAFLGERAAAAEAAGRAWSAAPGAPAHANAPLRAALLQAALAADAGDQDRLLVMLNSARASAVKVARVGASLPTCGDGVTPADYVIFAAYGRGAETGHVVPLVASRPGVVAPFSHALTGRWVLDRESMAPAGTVFTVRCRTIAGSGWRPPGRGDTLTRIYAEHGIYLLPTTEWDAARVAAIEEEIARIEAAHGREHPSLIPLLLELRTRMVPRLAGASDRSAMEDIDRRGQAALRQLPGAAPLVPDETDLQSQVAAAASAEQAGAIVRRAIRHQIGRLPLDDAYEDAMRWLDEDDTLPDADKRALVEELLRRFDNTSADPRRRSLLIRLANVQRAMGEYDAARRLLREARVPGDTCQALLDGTQMVSGEITADDYPRATVRYELAGLSLVEFDMDDHGNVTSQRMILSAPSLLFDEASTRGLATYRYTTTRPGDRLRACRAQVQPVRWQLAGFEDEASPAPGAGLSEQY